MILGQTPVESGRAVYEARRADAVAKNAAARAAANKARDDFEQNRQIVAGVSAAVAAIPALREGDVSGAAVAAASAAVPVLGRSIRVARQVNAGDYGDAVFSAGGFIRKVAPFLALGNIARQLMEGKTEAAAMSAARIAAVAIFGSGVLLVEGLVNFVRAESTRGDTQPPAPVEDRFIAADAPPDAVQIAEIAAIENNTLAIEQETAELTEASDVVEGFRFPGQFIGEGEAVPVNVLAMDGATSETGEAGYTPIAAMSLDGEILYDENYLPWIGGVMRAVAANVAPVAVYAIKRCCWSRSGSFNDCLTPATEPKFFYVPGSYAFTWKNDDFDFPLTFNATEGRGAAGEITYGCKQVPIIPVASSLPTVQVLPDAFAPDAGGAGAPYAPEDAPGAPYAPPSTVARPYVPPGAEGRPYYAPTPETGFNPPSGNLPQLPAGAIVPGTAFDFVEQKKPFPWWLVAAVITLS